MEEKDFEISNVEYLINRLETIRDSFADNTMSDWYEVLDKAIEYIKGEDKNGK